jgi:hypothetical protein
MDNLLKRVLVIILISLKAFWEATISIVSGFVSIIFLSIGVIYLNANGLMSSSPVDLVLANIIIVLSDNWKLFWVAFFIIYFLSKSNELKTKGKR